MAPNSVTQRTPSDRDLAALKDAEVRPPRGAPPAAGCPNIARGETVTGVPPRRHGFPALFGLQTLDGAPGTATGEETSHCPALSAERGRDVTRHYENEYNM